MTNYELNVLLDRMTLEEQVALLAGADMWTTVPVARLGIPAIKLTDGPNGARGGSFQGGVRAACFPAGIALGASWNPALVQAVGVALAEEARSKGARVLLGPTVNIQRDPRNGRNFECFAEDPVLTAELAVAYIRGVQSGGVAATIKHYAGNEAEFERMTTSSDIDERSLREVYLLPFEKAVKEAGVWAIMGAYNKLNGIYACEHPWLLTDVLRREWHYDGAVVSDWTATHSTVAALAAGLDLEMPGPPEFRGDKLLAAVQSGAVPQAAIRDSALRMLRLIARVGAFEDGAMGVEQAIDRPEHRALIRRAGAEGTVLLKNDGVLPLDRRATLKVAVIGPNARVARIMGGGSAQLNAHYRISPWQALNEQLGRACLHFEPGCDHYRYTPVLSQPLLAEFFNSADLSGPVVLHETYPQSEITWIGAVGPAVDRECFSLRAHSEYIVEHDGEYQLSLASAGYARLYVDGELCIDAWGERWQRGEMFFTFGSDELRRSRAWRAGQKVQLVLEYSSATQMPLLVKGVRLGVFLPLGSDAIARAVQLAAASDVALLFVGSNEEWDSEGQDRPSIELPGRQNELIETVAAANARTVVVLQSGAPVTMPWIDEVAAVLQAWYPGQECGNAIVDVLFGDADPGGRLPQTFPLSTARSIVRECERSIAHHTPYREGVFVGYRYYARAGTDVLFPFGHGLSYARFEYGGITLDRVVLDAGGTLRATVAVRNVSDRVGCDVVQLYVREQHPAIERPGMELKGFAKLFLQPGETQTAAFKLDMRSFAWFDAGNHAWRAKAGVFELLIGASSGDIRARTQIQLVTNWIEPVVSDDRQAPSS